MKEALPSTLSVPPVGVKPEARGYVLSVVSDAGVVQIPFEPGRVIRIGRRATSDVVVDHPGASRDHAIVHPGDPPVIEDLGSANGTFVQGERILAGARVALPIGGVALVAGVSFFVRERGEKERPSRPAVGPSGTVRSLVLRDEKMQELMRVIGRVAQSSMPVLILGETGVGKELLAERVHRLSPRRERPYLRVNCAALAEGTLASELFGHERGAFTGAYSSKIGLFEAANGGTLFLDEVGELSLETQAKLLRVLETGEVIRVGAHQPRQVDVRVVSATNRDLRVLVAERRFRADLYYRLNGISAQVPPLRERHADIIPLAEYFIARSADMMALEPPHLSGDACATLLSHRWPGNVRELKHVIERAVVLEPGPLLDSGAFELDPALPNLVPSAHEAASARDLLRSFEANRASDSLARESPRASDSNALRSRPPSSNSRLRAARRAEQLRAELVQAERDRIVEALQQAGNQAGAARLLGMSRRSLLYRLDAYDIPRPRKGRPKQG